MAQVWAGRLLGKESFSRLVAIKTILPHLAEDAEFERMFLDEARIAAGILHPNVCTVHELGEHDGVLYVVMEWINGDSLSRMLRVSHPSASPMLDARLAARMVSDACAGLHAAHELRDDAGQLLEVVHRDVSPHNILVSLEGTVKIADFGVVKSRGQLHKTTATGQAKGKVAYMAPEQLRSRPLDRRADVFSMGCVLYELTMGRRPFQGDNEAATIRAILEGEYPDPETLMPACPPELASILARALAPEADARFASAEAMHLALDAWVGSGEPALTAKDTAQFVRDRLGPELERRSEHIRAAMRSLGNEGSSPTRAAGTRARSPSPRPPPALPPPKADVRSTANSISVDLSLGAPKRSRRSRDRLRERIEALAFVVVALGLLASLIGAGLISVSSSTPKPSAAASVAMPSPSASGSPSGLPEPSPPRVDVPPRTSPALPPPSAHDARNIAPPSTTRGAPRAHVRDDDIPSFR